MKRTALVTGASRGIGREVARELSLEGYRVLSAIRAAADAPPLPGGTAEVLDVGSPVAIERFSERLLGRGEKLEILVNNAGVY
jgi:NAD(P)-dependent dehydrogenase (short-subunit alcohol dehydrogenase family)